jgi:hypothetical protein
VEGLKRPTIKLNTTNTNRKAVREAVVSIASLDATDRSKLVKAANTIISFRTPGLFIKGYDVEWLGREGPLPRHEGAHRKQRLINAFFV